MSSKALGICFECDVKLGTPTYHFSRQIILFPGSTDNFSPPSDDPWFLRPLLSPTFVWAYFCTFYTDTNDMFLYAINNCLNYNCFLINMFFLPVCITIPIGICIWLVLNWWINVGQPPLPALPKAQTWWSCSVPHPGFWVSFRISPSPAPAPLPSSQHYPSFYFHTASPDLPPMWRSSEWPTHIAPSTLSKGPVPGSLH